jgi:hypothetical protein
MDALRPLFPEVFTREDQVLAPPLGERERQQVLDLVSSPDLEVWSEALERVGNCAQPVRLRGWTETIDTTTGEIVSTYRSEDEPLGVTHVRCGNRRASECPSCSRLYAADTFHLIRAGVAGGKTVPESVAENPLVFATLTAPSFGKVHTRADWIGQCHRRTRGPSHCKHGRPRTCPAVHAEGDELLGQPLCEHCYDYASHVVWQWWAPDLWRRFTIALRRGVAKKLGIPASRLVVVATVQYAKVAEYQLRGMVHFHALIRLDGPRTSDGFAPAPRAIGAAEIADLVRQAATSVRLTVPGVDSDDPGRTLAFGRQLDARPVRIGRRTDDLDRALTPEQVAGYLAKYATKSAADSGAADTPHHRRLRATVRTMADRAAAASGSLATGPYELLEKWTHMLGFRGHFASKSRRYSITLGALRRARRRAQIMLARAHADGRPLDLAALEADLLADEDGDTILVIGRWQYAGSGWNTGAERALAVAAAARAREHDQWKAEQRRQQRSAERTR